MENIGTFQKLYLLTVRKKVVLGHKGVKSGELPLFSRSPSMISCCHSVSKDVSCSLAEDQKGDKV